MHYEFLQIKTSLISIVKKLDFLRFELCQFTTQSSEVTLFFSLVNIEVNKFLMTEQT